MSNTKNKRCNCKETKRLPLCDIISLGDAECCCWCADTRSSEEKINPEIHVDGLGTVQPKKYHLKWPVDIGYCPKCRRSRKSSAELYNVLRVMVKYTKMMQGDVC